MRWLDWIVGRRTRLAALTCVRVPWGAVTVAVFLAVNLTVDVLTISTSLVQVTAAGYLLGPPTQKSPLLLLFTKSTTSEACSASATRLRSFSPRRLFFAAVLPEATSAEARGVKPAEAGTVYVP
jgi:hypothetical protein